MSSKTPRASGANVTASAPKYQRLRFFVPLVIFIVLLVGGAYFWVVRNSCDLRLGSGCVTLERVSTEAARAQGLSGRQHLPGDEAMLFIYEAPGNYCLWMKDMQFPIDIVWLNSDRQVITTASDVQPGTFPESFCPDQAAQYILEFAAGSVQHYDLTVGEHLEF